MGIEIIIPCNPTLQMPATSLTWAELFDPLLTPADTPQGTSGLALADKAMQPGSLPLPAYEIHIQGNIVTDSATGSVKHIAGLVFISQQSLRAISSPLITLPASFACLPAYLPADFRDRLKSVRTASLQMRVFGSRMA